MSSTFEKDLIEAWQEDLAKCKKPNILILGGTKVGKSTLVNMVFGRDMAVVSDTRPETKGINEYADEELSVNLFDSEGYELDKEENYYQNVIGFLRKREQDQDISRQIHLVWYCISVSNHRVQNIDIDVIKSVKDIMDKNICIVFTKCDLDDETGGGARELYKTISKELNSIIPHYQVSNDETLTDTLELESLLQWSANSLSNDSLRQAFIKAQTASLYLKKKEARKITLLSVAAAAGVGATPIPFSDAAVLVPIQTVLCAKIINIFGLDMMKGMANKIVGGAMISVIGKTLAGNILKFIPAVGSFFGALINASVASSMTAALGFGLSEICSGVCLRIIRGEEVNLEDEFNYENVLKHVMDIIARNKGQKDPEKWETEGMISPQKGAFSE